MSPCRPAAPVRRPRAGRHRDEEGGLWIRIGIVLGVVFYGFLLVLWAAGFTAILPFVVIPLVLVALIGANSLLGGPRRRQQLEPRPVGPARGADDPGGAPVRPGPDGPEGGRDGGATDDGEPGTVG